MAWQYGHNGSGALVTDDFLHHDNDYKEISFCFDQNTNNTVTT